MRRSSEIAKLMKNNGFFILRKNNHIVWRHPTSVTITTSLTPSCKFTLHKIKRKIRLLLQSGVQPGVQK